jgi:hypothetical protein
MIFFSNENLKLKTFKSVEIIIKIGYAIYCYKPVFFTLNLKWGLMQGIEVKFLFEGVIFSSIVNMFSVSDKINSYEFSINFLSNYLAKRYSSVYFLVFENNKFKPVYTNDEKEQELIRTIQDAILRLPGLIKQKFLPDHT